MVVDNFERVRVEMSRRLDAWIEALRELEAVLLSHDLVAAIAAEDAVAEAGADLAEPVIRVCNGVRC